MGDLFFLQKSESKNALYGRLFSHKYLKTNRSPLVGVFELRFIEKKKTSPRDYFLTQNCFEKKGLPQRVFLDFFVFEKKASPSWCFWEKYVLERDFEGKQITKNGLSSRVFLKTAGGPPAVFKKFLEERPFLVICFFKIPFLEIFFSNNTPQERPFFFKKTFGVFIFINMNLKTNSMGGLFFHQKS